MKIFFIIVRYKAPLKEINRLKIEIKSIGLTNYSLYVSDNTKNNVGFAAAVNRGIKKGLTQKADLFVVVNQDVSFNTIKSPDIKDTFKRFDIFGFAMKEGNITYYGGEIDKWRLSGGLISKKPKNKFVNRDFVIGSLMFIKKEVIEKIRLFDEKYFMYYEDVDYCVRAKQKGFKVGINSEKKYTHLSLLPSHKDKEYLLAKNRLKFFLKYSFPLEKLREVVRLPKTLWEENELIKVLLSKNPFLINFFSFNTSSFINKFFNFVLFIFLLRYLSIREYGVYTLVWAQVGLLSPLVDFGTTSYGLIYLPTERKNHIQTLLSMRLFLALIVFFLTILLAIFLRYEMTTLFYISLISFTIFSNMWSGSYLILTSVEQKNYRAALVSIIFNFFLISFSILVLIISKQLSILFLLIFLFYNVYTIVNINLVKKDVGTIILRIDFKKFVEVAKKSYVFVLISLFAGLYFKLDVLLLKFLKNDVEVGIYSAGYKFFEALIVIASAYNFSATPVLSKLAKINSNVLVKRMKKDIFFLGILGILVVLVSYLVAPVILPAILKNDFRKSMEVFRIVITALPFLLITSVFLNGLYVIKKSHLVIFLFAVLTLVNFVLNYLFIPQFSYIASSYITVLSEVLSTILSFFLFYFVTK